MNRDNPHDWAAIGIIVAITIIGLILIAGKAHAGPARCGPHAEIVKVLKQKYRESRRAAGISLDGQRAFRCTPSTSLRANENLAHLPLGDVRLRRAGCAFLAGRTNPGVKPRSPK